MGGKGGGEGSGAKTLGKIAKQVNEEVTPLRQEWLAQLMSVVKGGANAFAPTKDPYGVPGALPIFQSEISQSQQANARSYQQTKESLARSGLAGTPFGERALTETRNAGLQATAGIPGRLAEGMLGQVGGATLGLTNSSIGAASGQAQAQAQSAGGKSSALGGLGMGAGQMAAAKGGGGAGAAGAGAAKKAATTAATMAT